MVESTEVTEALANPTVVVSHCMQAATREISSGEAAPFSQGQLPGYGHLGPEGGI